MAPIHETNWDLIVSNEELAEVAVNRLKEFIEESVDNSLLEDRLNNGWKLKKQNKRKSTIYKEKKVGDAFEDEVWSIFYKMGFKYMNKDNSFSVLYSRENGLSKQIDIVAIDDEVCLLIECKESAEYGARRSFQMDINEVPSFYGKVCSEIKSKYPNLKFKYIFATKNVAVGQQDKNRMKEHNIVHFDYSTVLYYKALVEHLGSAAKYQLLGQIFSGQKISNLDVQIPAIKGKMGPFTYYSFVMQPEQLLKIAYVLHRTNANNDYDDLLPSYQRLIKKERLQSVREFINTGNFFPNSLVISIDTSRSDLTFDLAPAQFNQNRLMKMGVLHLPQIYQSAYIIDGQHRLYGYSDSEHVEDNSIPVVAFVNLKKSEQLKLFMEINLNQKPVPKALRNILEIDVYYDSENPKLAQGALLGKIAKHLGEDNLCALKGRVVIGEDAATKRCCITIENIKLALEKTAFFNKLKKNGQIQPNGEGIFDKNNNDNTFNAIYPILRKFFNSIKEEFLEDWNKDDSFYVKNNMIGGLIRILNDIITINYEKDPTILDNNEVLWNKCQDFMTILLLALDSLTPEERADIIKAKGAGAPTDVYRKIQMKMFELDSSFSNEDIETYYINYYKNYNDEAQPQINKIREALIREIKNIFNENNWMRLHLSEHHENELAVRVLTKNNANERNGIQQRVDEWEEINFEDIKKIIDHASNWSTYFKEIFTRYIPDCNKNYILTLMMTINKCSTSIRNGHKINGVDFREINRLFKAIEEISYETNI